MSFYSLTKFSILSPLNLRNQITLEQHWGLLEGFFSKTKKIGRKLQKLQKKITFSAECHFHHGGYINKQNYSIWGSNNAQHPIHPLQVTS